MQHQQDELVPINDALADLPGTTSPASTKWTSLNAAFASGFLTAMKPIPKRWLHKGTYAQWRVVGMFPGRSPVKDSR